MALVCRGSYIMTVEKVETRVHGPSMRALGERGMMIPGGLTEFCLGGVRVGEGGFGKRV